MLKSAIRLNFLITASILAIDLSANAQQATIKDPDGYTNVHAGSSLKTKVIGRFYNGDVFNFGNEENGWVKVYYWPADSSEQRSFEGYIYKDRLFPFDKIRRLREHQKTLTIDHLKLHFDSVTVDLITAPFRSAHHIVRYGSPGFYIVKIDGKRPMGTDGEIPHEELVGLHMTTNGAAMHIPASAWDNLYDPDFRTCHAYFDTGTGFMYISLASTRSAAGGYDVVWIFKNGRYIKRYVDQSNN